MRFLDFVKVKNNAFWESLLNSKISFGLCANTALLQSIIPTFPHELYCIHIPKCRLGSHLRALTTQILSSFPGREGGREGGCLNIWAILNPAREQPKGDEKVKMAAALAGSKLYSFSAGSLRCTLKKQMDFDHTKGPTILTSLPLPRKHPLNRPRK